MAKIVLGKRPENFKHTVKFQMLDGTQGSVEVLYKYRTKKEFGEFIDELIEYAKIEAPKEDDPAPFSMAVLMEKTAGSNASYILDVVTGWNLDVELNKENVQALADVYPAAAAAIMETYRTACIEGRLGN